jgi:hypothetical protein
MFTVHYTILLNKQVMASGMTLSTAVPGRKCDSYMLDPAHLRDHPECDIVLEPNFGMLEIEWSNSSSSSSSSRNSSSSSSSSISSVKLQVRDALGAVRLQSLLTPDMCI